MSGSDTGVWQSGVSLSSVKSSTAAQSCGAAQVSVKCHCCSRAMRQCWLCVCDCCLLWLRARAELAPGCLKLLSRTVVFPLSSLGPGIAYSYVKNTVKLLFTLSSPSLPAEGETMKQIDHEVHVLDKKLEKQTKTLCGASGPSVLL